jgi:F-type H+-transporting ATPase subunit b
MTFNLWTFLFEIVNFVVLAYVLYRILYHPLRKAVEERREATNRAQADAEAARRDAAALEQKLKAQLADLDRQRQDSVRQAREQAEAERKKILSETEQVVQRRQEDSRKALERERDEALESLRAEVIGQAADLAERFLDEAANETLNRQLALKLIEVLSHLPAGEREDLQRQWKPVDGAVLETAKELDDATLGQLAQTVTAALGQQVTLAVHIQTNLIGGVRLRLGGNVWDASLAGALEQVRHAKSEVAGHV